MTSASHASVVAASDRYQRQRIVPEIGEAGQAAIRDARVLVLGVGALGSQAADLLVRAGVGRLRLVDRDVVETTNLQRQTLYAEADVDRPKADVAAARLRAVNSDVAIEGVPRDFNARTVADLLEGIALVIDGTDNLASRLLLNDACLQRGLPWIYGGAIGTHGMVLPVVPGGGPCFRCLVPEPPPPGTLPTCDTAGIVNAVPAAVAALQVALGLRVLLGSPLPPRLYLLDVWTMEFERLDLRRRTDCRACVRHAYDFLAAPSQEVIASLCGRDAVSLDPGSNAPLDLERLSERLKRVGKVRRGGSAVSFEADGIALTIFPDGRALIRGTEDPDRARALYAKYVGR